LRHGYCRVSSLACKGWEGGRSLGNHHITPRQRRSSTSRCAKGVPRNCSRCADGAGNQSTNYVKMLFGVGSGEIHLGRRIQLAFWLQVLMQFGTGIAAVVVYSSTIFIPQASAT
jgi:hypothetical protein